MRLLIGVLLVLILVVLLDYSDFFLTRFIRKRVGEINENALKSFGYKPINRLSLSMASLLFWLPPIYFISNSLLLEYKILVTILYWIVASTCHALYIRRNSSPTTAKQSLPFIISFAIGSGLFLGPVLGAVNALLGIQ